MKSWHIWQRSSATSCTPCVFASCPAQTRPGSRRCATPGRRHSPRFRSFASNAASPRPESRSSRFGPTPTRGRVGSCRQRVRSGSRLRRSMPSPADAFPSQSASEAWITVSTLFTPRSTLPLGSPSVGLGARTSPMAGPGDTDAVVEFRPDGAGTRVTLRQRGFTESALRTAHERGWNRCLEGMARLLAETAG